MKVEAKVLKRTGPIPYWRGEKKCLQELDRYYRKAKEFAERHRKNYAFGN